MIEKIKYLFAGALAVVLVALVGCSNDDSAFDEFDATYAYIARTTLGQGTAELAAQHTPEGIVTESGAEIAIPITLRLSKPMSTEVTVTLGKVLEGFPANAFSFKKSEKHVIPAGDLEVKDTLIFNKDWGFALDTKPATTYKATVMITDVKPQSGALLISKNLRSQSLTVNKKRYFASNIIPNQQPIGTLLEPRTSWVVKWTGKDDAPADWATTTNVTDSKTTYILNTSSSIALSISIDLGAEQTITGLKNAASSSTYAHNNCVIFSSNDGVDWKMESDSQLRDVVSAKLEQYLSFKIPIKARYIRWDMWNTASTREGRCRSNEVYVYVQP